MKISNGSYGKANLSIVSLIVLFLIVSSARADAVFVAGDVSGIWSADSVIVADSVYVQPGDTLIIDPGVNIYFLSYYKFVIMQDAVLHAAGTESDSIKFIPFQYRDRGLGLDFIGASDQSILEYCVIDSALTSAIHLDNSSITISHCLLINNEAPTGSIGGGAIEAINGSNAVIHNNIIRNNNSAAVGGGIYCQNSSPSIVGNEITDNLAGYYGDASGGGINCYDHSNAEIRDNIIARNTAYPVGGFSQTSGAGGGITCVDYSNAIISGNIIDSNVVPSEVQTTSSGGGIFIFHADPTIDNNVITNNRAERNDGGGIYMYEAHPVITNNTIAYNMAGERGQAIYAEFSDATLTNSILYFDSGQEIYTTSDASITATYSDIQGGYDGEGNIDTNPLFRDSANGDFHLMSTECGDSQDSPLIDAGSPDIVDMTLDCMHGLGTYASDMGAYGGQGIPTGTTEPDNQNLPNLFSLSQNYPNPFNASTVIEYNLVSTADVNLAIYDILGRQVKDIDFGVQQPGTHSYNWHANGLPSGAYFYRLTAGDRTETRKMLYLK